MIVYTSTDDTGFTYLAEIPVDQDPKSLAKDMSMGKSPEGKALKFVHRGSYENMDNTYEAITNHLDDKKLEAICEGCRRRRGRPGRERSRSSD